MKSFELFLALRYMKGGRQAAGGAVTSAIAVGGVAVGVAALIATLAVMTGFREDIRRKILGAQPHIMAMGAGRTLPAGDWSYLFDGVPGVVAWSPYAAGEVIIKKGQAARGILVKGVDPAGEPAVTGLDQRLSDGRWADLGSPPESGARAVFLGKELAKTLDAGVGTRVLLAVPADDAPSMMEAPLLFPFIVKGILETGLYDYDLRLAVVSLESAQKIFHLEGRVTGLGVRVTDPDNAHEQALRIQKNAGSGLWAQSWLYQNRNLFAALKLEKVVMFLILALITLVAAFTILSNLILVTAQKVREIGILKAMGATEGMVQRVFLYKGLVMGGLGTGVGTALGLTIAWVLKRYQFLQLPADVYYVENLPVQIVPGDVALVAGAAFLIVLAASVYPARMAARLDALTSLRQ